LVAGLAEFGDVESARLFQENETEAFAVVVFERSVSLPSLVRFPAEGNLPAVELSVSWAVDEAAVTNGKRELEPPKPEELMEPGDEGEVANSASGGGPADGDNAPGSDTLENAPPPSDVVAVDSPEVAAEDLDGTEDSSGEAENSANVEQDGADEADDSTNAEEDGGAEDDVEGEAVGSGGEEEGGDETAEAAEDADLDDHIDPELDEPGRTGTDGDGNENSRNGDSDGVDPQPASDEFDAESDGF
jgi:hypothetical protein